MPLHKIKEFYPDYRDQFGDHDLMGYSLYAGSDKVGSVDDLLVDDEGRFRYLIVNTGAWIFGKKVLLPIGQTRIDYTDRKVYADRLTREQVEQLPEYDANATTDYDHEERVRGVYRPTTSAATGTALSGTTAGMGAAGIGTTPLDTPASVDATPGMSDRTYNRTYDRDSYRYDYDPDLYNLNEQDHQTLRLYEERLIANKMRQKTGEVSVGKHVETETQQVSVPVDRERVVIERVTPTNVAATDIAGTGAFQEGEVVRMEVYEETPDIRKETFVREEVQVRKEVDHDTVASEETIRRERLDVDKDGNPIVRD